MKAVLVCIEKYTLFRPQIATPEPSHTVEVFFRPWSPDTTEDAFLGHLLAWVPPEPTTEWQRDLDRLDLATRRDLAILVTDIRTGNLDGYFVDEDRRSPPELGRYVIMRGEVLATFNVEAGRNRLAVLHYPINPQRDAA